VVARKSGQLNPACDIGIDIGATSVKAGIVKRDGRLIEKAAIKTSEIQGPDHFLTLLETLIGQMLKDGKIEKRTVGGIGVGAPGWVEHDKGIVRELTNIPDWEDVPLAQRLEEGTGLKSFVDNDANAMALAELHYGAGRGHRNIVCLTLGTGVGGAVVINGEVFRGAHGLAGEIGHITLDLEGPECACGGRGCLENYVGNRFIVENAVKRLEQDSQGAQGALLLNMAGGDPKKITPKMLSEAAYKGDTIAIKVWHETGRYIGIALAGLVNLLNPECFIIGGGVAKAGAILFDEMRKTMESLAMNDLGKETPILEAQLSADAGIIGAATLAMGCIEKG
jgi:glucokinase